MLPPPSIRPSLTSQGSAGEPALTQSQQNHARVNNVNKAAASDKQAATAAATAEASNDGDGGDGERVSQPDISTKPDSQDKARDGMRRRAEKAPPTRRQRQHNSSVRGTTTAGRAGGERAMSGR